MGNKEAKTVQNTFFEILTAFCLLGKFPETMQAHNKLLPAKEPHFSIQKACNNSSESLHMQFAFPSQPSQLTPTNSIPVSIPQGSLHGITRLDRGTLLHSHHMMPVSSQTQF